MIDVQFLWEIANRVETKVLFVVIAVKLAIENVPGWRLLGQALIIYDDTYQEHENTASRPGGQEQSTHLRNRGERPYLPPSLHAMLTVRTIESVQEYCAGNRPHRSTARYRLQRQQDSETMMTFTKTPEAKRP
jgi:hypothetical protein